MKVDHNHDWNLTPYLQHAIGYHSKRDQVAGELLVSEHERTNDVTWYVGTVFACRVPGCDTFLFTPYNPQFTSTECELAPHRELRANLAAA